MKVLHRKLARDMWKARGQSLAVALVILCGAATYITLASLHRDLLLTRDTYYDRYRFADFEIMLERAPLSAVRKLEGLPGVRQARGRIVKDVNVDLAGIDEPRVGRIVSMPNRPRPVLDDICLQEGRYFDPGARDEVIVSTRFAQQNRLRPGDSLHVTINDRKYPLRVVGLALSPEYVYMIRNAQELIPSPERFGILWTPEDFAETAFDMQDGCNNIVGAVDATAQLDDLLNRAEKLLRSYGVFASIKAHDQISNRFLSDEIAGLGVSAQILPTVFQGVASLVLLVLLNRMVRQQRTEIGLLKAYGYSSAAVAFLYVKFALALALAGVGGGLLLGRWLAHLSILMYVQFFDFPLLRSGLYPRILLLTVLYSVGAAVLGALMAAVRAARLQPAESLRPEAPRYAHRTCLERVTPLWQRLGFTGKMIVRNLSRNAFRAGLTVFGVAVSTALLVLGYFLTDSFVHLMEFHFTEVQREDIQIALTRELGKAALYDMQRLEHVERVEPMLQYPFRITAAWRSKDAAVIGIPPHSRLHCLIDTRGRRVQLDTPGLVLSDFLARELDVSVGDRVLLKPLMGKITRERPVRVSRVVTQYLGSAAYMNLDGLSRLLDEPFAMNTALLACAPGTERSVAAAVKDIPAIASVQIKADAYRNLQDTLAMSVNINNAMIIFFSGVVAFAVIYNVTLVSLAERRRELASLRVLGFSPGEVGRILYLENVLLAVLGTALGIPLGLLLSKALIAAYDTELYRMPYYVTSATFIKSVCAIAAFVLFANGAVRRKIYALDMVETLKARE